MELVTSSHPPIPNVLFFHAHYSQSAFTAPIAAVHKSIMRPNSLLRLLRLRRYINPLLTYLLKYYISYCIVLYRNIGENLKTHLYSSHLWSTLTVIRTIICVLWYSYNTVWSELYRPTWYNSRETSVVTILIHGRDQHDQRDQWWSFSTLFTS